MGADVCFSCGRKSRHFDEPPVGPVGVSRIVGIGITQLWHGDQPDPPIYRICASCLGLTPKGKR